VTKHTQHRAVGNGERERTQGADGLRREDALPVVLGHVLDHESRLLAGSNQVRIFTRHMAVGALVRFTEPPIPGCQEVKEPLARLVRCYKIV